MWPLPFNGQGHAPTARAHIQNPNPWISRHWRNAGHALEKPPYHFFGLGPGNEDVSRTAESQPPKFGPADHALDGYAGQSSPQVALQPCQFSFVIPTVQGFEHKTASVVEIGHQPIGHGPPLPRLSEHGQRGSCQHLPHPSTDGHVPVVLGQGLPHLSQGDGGSIPRWPDSWPTAHCVRRTGAEAC